MDDLAVMCDEVIGPFNEDVDAEANSNDEAK